METKQERLEIKSKSIQNHKESEFTNNLFQVLEYSNEPNLVKQFIEKGADLSATKNSATPILMAARKGYFNIVQLIAETKNTSREDNFDYAGALVSIIHNSREASEEEQYKCAWSLLKAGAQNNLNRKTTHGNTSLHFASLRNKPQLVALGAWGVMERPTDLRKGLDTFVHHYDFG